MYKKHYNLDNGINRIGYKFISTARRNKRAFLLMFCMLLFLCIITVDAANDDEMPVIRNFWNVSLQGQWVVSRIQEKEEMKKCSSMMNTAI